MDRADGDLGIQSKDREDVARTDVARIVVDAASHVLDASDRALELLGLDLDQLRALPPGALSLEADRAAMDGLEEEWREAGAGPLVGAGTVRLLDGRLIRMRYMVLPQTEDRFDIVIEPIDEPTSRPPTAYTVGTVLSAWRAADRHLQRLDPTDPEWAEATEQVERFRTEYRRLVAIAEEKGSAGHR